MLLGAYRAANSSGWLLADLETYCFQGSRLKLNVLILKGKATVVESEHANAF